MTSKTLVGIGLAWFGIVVLWVCFFDQAISIAWPVRSPIKQWASIAILYLLISTYFVFLVGWLIPLGFGIYRLVRHH
jgi:hypothetical protein